MSIHVGGIPTSPDVGGIPTTLPPPPPHKSPTRHTNIHTLANHDCKKLRAGRQCCGSLLKLSQSTEVPLRAKTKACSPRPADLERPGLIMHSTANKGSAGCRPFVRGMHAAPGKGGRGAAAAPSRADVLSETTNSIDTQNSWRTRNTQ